MAMKVVNSGLETRKPGYTVKAGVSILAGKPVRFDPTDTTGATIQLADGGCGTTGFALESNVAPLSLNMFFDEVNRGGLISYVCGNGIEIEVWNDGRGDIFVTTDTFTPGALVYSSAAGLITTTASVGGSIGKVTKAPSSATDSLKIQISL